MSTEEGARLRQVTLTGSAVLLAVAIAVPMLLVRETRSAAPSRFIVPSTAAEPVSPVTPGSSHPVAVPGTRTVAPPHTTGTVAPESQDPARPAHATSATVPVPATATTTGATASTEPPPPAPPSPDVPALVAGAVIGLEPAARPGHRLGHGRAHAWIGTVRPGDSAPDRLATRFVVRPGLADPACVSLESAARPGHFLRHRTFLVRVDRQRSSDSTFPADATFCPVPDKPGERVTLRSANYPDRYVTVRRGKLVLAPASTGDAATFVVRPPL
ncbi:alpha-L-arabinofuranosidase B-like protein [Krasilnikovia cinnamomea]|uniref:Alpha-L-arabinofuranosidase B-like protein n=1 Tax=Krasilnikovia cinnamomea TaxID=349313 RepID=A0A4Q7ZEZ4_9ACTN|nr:AbfB domain-containing protein [Krasilnikovia cinnamomea]RZU48655.1 alpha-L-arabinofuranosidase B-like protein [Krasilnikovia cinnamomea]